MRVGVMILPEHRWADEAPMWRRIEALGFDHAWTCDHLAWRSLRDSPWFAAVPRLTAAALVTTHIPLGFLVASPNFRHPVPFARELLGLDDVTGGRLIAGLGAGGVGWDAVMLGQERWSLKERAARFEEFVRLLDLLLRQDETSYAGEYYSAVEARSHPGCIQQPRVPFAIAATGPRGMRLAVDHATTWITTGDRAARDALVPPAEGAVIVREQIERLEAACADAGRDPATLDRLVLLGPELEMGLGSRAQFDETVSAYAAVGATDVVIHWPRPSEPYAGDPAILDQLR
jgi:alkanesulfonate monooxygenase SsuD/methylene tetrahydromethanopterin reductase-like flavin-dependent oxidoreductase (luciferase family)